MKANNEMYNSNTSPTLNKALGESPVEDLAEKINFLRQCGVSEENIAMIADANMQTVNHLANILDEHPAKEVVGLVNDELEKVSMQANITYLRAFRGISLEAANDELYGEDENRPYGGLGNVA